jgi:fucose permease
VDVAQQGAILGVVYLGIWLTTPVVGPVIDGFGNKVVLFTSGVLVTIALLAFARVTGYGAALAAAVILGAGGGGLNTSTNAMVSDVFGEERGPYLNYLGIFFGVGALFVPLLAANISQLISPAQIILCTVVLVIAFTVWSGVLAFPAPREAHSFQVRDALRVATYPGVLLFALLLFFESGNEAVITGFASTYTGSLGAGGRSASWALSCYMAALMCGRIVAGRFYARAPKGNVVLVSAVGGTLAYALFVFGHSLAIMLFTAAAVGFTISAIYPTTLAMIGDRYQRFSASVFSFIFTVAMTGGILFPWVVGRLGKSMGLQTGMLVALFGWAAVVMMVLTVRKEPDAPQVRD